ncbi:MAG: sugar transferase [Bdellovibrionales bacterium]|nr:sugar transferase [Bdellovibrionales bacterium]
MLKSHWRLISRLERIGDNLLVIVAFFLSYYLRDPFFAAANDLALPFPQELQALGRIENYLLVLGLALPLYNAFLSILGAYRSMRFMTAWQLLRITCLASGMVFLCQGSFLYLLKLDLSRSFVALFCMLCGVAHFSLRVLVLSLLRFFRVRGKNFRNILIVGTGPQARRVYLEVARQPELGVRVKGFVSVDGLEHSQIYDLPARVVADEQSFESGLKRLAIDEVLFTDVVSVLPQVRELAEIAVEEGVRVTLAADFFSLEIFKSDISYFGSIPLIHYTRSPAGEESGALVVKRLLDVAISGVLLFVLSPMLLVVALLIKLETPGPVFFRQRRVGLNGRTFILLKFRSMVDDAERMLEELRHQNEMQGPVFKLKNDPRVTRIGRFIRRFSIDELPQLINVLKGDMSLVGPRPPLPEEVSLYLRRHRRRLSMRPGLTCTWQVSGRNEIPDFDEWTRLDLEYIDNWTLREDLKLLLRTVPAVLVGTGAR